MSTTTDRHHPHQHKYHQNPQPSKSLAAQLLGQRGVFRLPRRSNGSGTGNSHNKLMRRSSSSDSLDAAAVHSRSSQSKRAANGSAKSKLWGAKSSESISVASKSTNKQHPKDVAMCSIVVNYRDEESNRDYLDTLCVGNRSTSLDVIKAALERFKLNTSSSTSDEYQLFVKRSGDEAPVLIGNDEHPFAIKMNTIRAAGVDASSMGLKCSFILRTKKSHKKKHGQRSLSDEKSAKKGRRTAFNWLWRNPLKSSSASNNNSNATASAVSSPFVEPGSRPAFSSSLLNFCVDERLSTPIINMLQQLYAKGPFTVGIFRKSANARVCKELKHQLEQDSSIPLDEFPVPVIASVFKELLRSLPDCLLSSSLYTDWIAAVNSEQEETRAATIRGLLSSLPAENRLLLHHFLLVLHRISANEAENKMSSLNLGVCIGPSLLSSCNTISSNSTPTRPSAQRCEEILNQVPKLIAYLIDHCLELLDEDEEASCLVALKGDGGATKTHDSGAEEDSLGSSSEGMVSNSNPGTSNAMDANANVVVVDTFQHHPRHGSKVVAEVHCSSSSSSSPLANKMSLSNLSRDSGLTLSDTQLYTPDEESEGSAASDQNGAMATGGSSTIDNRLSKSSPALVKNLLEASAAYDSPLNVTFSYGRSVGVSIDGSCHDVVRKRRHQDPAAGAGHRPLAREHYNQYNHQHEPARRLKPVRSRPPTLYANLDCVDPSPAGLSYSKSYAFGINENRYDDDEEMTAYDREQRSDAKNENSVELGNKRCRRPPLSALIHRNSAAAELACRRRGVTRRSNSEESLVFDYRSRIANDEPMSLPAYQRPLPAQKLDEKFMQTHPKALMLQELEAEEKENLDDHNNNGLLKVITRKPPVKSCSSRSSNPLTIAPPSYTEAMNRKESLARIQSFTPSSRRLPSVKMDASSKIFEESVRVYQEDLQKGSGMFLRAIPVHVHTNESSSDEESIPPSRRSTVIFRAAKDPVSIKRAPLRLTKSVSGGVLPNRSLVAVKEHCAKDAHEDWRKEINWSVAHLRSIFGGESPVTKSSPSASASNSTGSSNKSITDDSGYHDESSAPLTSASPSGSSSAGASSHNSDHHCVTIIPISAGGGSSILVPVHHSTSGPSLIEESYV